MLQFVELLATGGESQACAAVGRPRSVGTAQYSLCWLVRQIVEVAPNRELQLTPQVL